MWDIFFLSAAMSGSAKWEMLADIALSQGTGSPCGGGQGVIRYVWHITSTPLDLWLPSLQTLRD